MTVTWNKTNFPGVRYYAHATRKHGIQKDKYFAIRFQACGKRREEGLGWASEGWSAAKAAQTVLELKKAATRGEGATSLAEKRQKAEEKRQADTGMPLRVNFVLKILPVPVVEGIPIAP